MRGNSHHTNTVHSSHKHSALITQTQYTHHTNTVHSSHKHSALITQTQYTHYTNTLHSLHKHSALITQTQYTHYTNNGATRIDRIYITDPLKERKQGAETIIAPFTDHLAAVVRQTYSHQTNLRKRRLWKMNISLLENITFCDSLMLLWCKWKLNMKCFPSMVLWWNRYVKTRIRQTFQREGASRNKRQKRHGRFLLHSYLPRTTIFSHKRESRYCDTASKSENITSPKQKHERCTNGHR